MNIEELPVEILGHIFEIAVESVRVLPEVLLCVSRKWHQTTLSWPFLWSFISIVTENILDAQDTVDNVNWHIADRFPPNIKKVQAYLERSRDHPLTIALSFDPNHPDSTTLRQCLFALPPHVSRFRALYLRIVPGLATQQNSFPDPFSFPILDTLHLRTKNALRDCIHFFGSTPLLKSLTVHELSRFTFPKLMQSSIKTLTVGDQHPEQTGRALVEWENSNVEHLVLSPKPNLPTLYGRVPPIRLAHLVSLHIHDPTWLPVIQAMQLPRLMFLKISNSPATSVPVGFRGKQQKRTAKLFKALTPILSQIIELKMANVVPHGNSVHHWRSFLQKCIRLQRLELRGCDGASRAITENSAFFSNLAHRYSNLDEFRAWI